MQAFIISKGSYVLLKLNNYHSVKHATSRQFLMESACRAFCARDVLLLDRSSQIEFKVVVSKGPSR